jgi:restriction system protein
MAKQEKILALDLLLEELDQIVLRLNEEGAGLFKAGKYDQARALLSKVESVTGFRGKVLCLKDDWKALNVPSTRKLTGSQERSQHTTSPPLKPGLKTSHDEFRYPILAALVRLGGSGQLHAVLQIVEEIMGEGLNQYDYQPLPSNPNSVRWKNTASWARHTMVQDGLLAGDSPRGTWEITAAGRDALEKAKHEPDLQRKLFSGK